MITTGKYKHGFLEDTWAEVTDGDDELVIYTLITPNGSEKTCSELEVFTQLWFLPVDWKPNPHADCLRLVAMKIEQNPAMISQLQELVDSFKETK